MDSPNDTGMRPATPGQGRPRIPAFDLDSTSSSLPQAPSAAPSPAQAPSPAPVKRTPYVRRQAPRRTAEAIDDLAQDDNPTTYTHESDIAIGGVVGDRNYRKARSEITQFQKNNRYGQYLQVPKGRRSIFATQERSRRRRSALAAIVVIGILAAAAYLVWMLMSNASFG